MKIPCEEAVWEVLPKIRATLAWIMVSEFNLTGHTVSAKLGVIADTFMPAKSPKFVPFDGIPDPHCPVFPSAYKVVSICAEPSGVDWAPMAFENMQHSALSCLPYP